MEKLVYVDRRNTNCNKGTDSRKCSEKKDFMQCGWQIWTSVYRSV